MPLLLTGVISLTLGFIVAFALVSIVFTIFFILFAHEYFDLSAGRYSDCPFSIRERQSRPQSLYSVSENVPNAGEGILEETCCWVNVILEMALFNANESPIAKRIQELIVNRIEGKLSDISESKRLLTDLTLCDFVLGRKAPVIKVVRLIHGATGSLDLSFEIKFSGDASFFVAGNAGMGIGRVGNKLNLKRFRGLLLLRLVKTPSPRILIMLSELPIFTFAVEYGAQTLGRVSNLLMLVISSLLRNRIVFPNYQPVLLRAEAQIMKECFYVPLWKGARRFVRVRVESIVIDAALLAGVGVGSTIYCIITMGGTRVKTQDMLPSNMINFSFLHQFPLEGGDLDKAELRLSVLHRRSRYMKKLTVFEVILPLSSVPANVVYTMGLRPESNANGSDCRASVELYLCTDPLSVKVASTWPLAAGLAPLLTEDQTQPNQYLDGVNWGNLKLVWNNFKKSAKDSSFKDELFQALGEDVSLTSSGDGSLANFSCPNLAIEDGQFLRSSGERQGLASHSLDDLSTNSSQSLVIPSPSKSPTSLHSFEGMRQLTLHELDFDLVPSLDDLERDRLLVILNNPHGKWLVSIDGSRFSVSHELKENLPLSQNTEEEQYLHSMMIVEVPAMVGGTGNDQCTLTIEHGLLMLWKYVHRPVFMAEMQHLETLEVRKMAEGTNLAMVSVTFSTGSRVDFRLEEVDAATLLCTTCVRQARIPGNVALEAFRDAQLVCLGSWKFLVIGYESWSDDNTTSMPTQVIIPVPGSQVGDAKEIFKRLYQRAAVVPTTEAKCGAIIMHVELEARSALVTDIIATHTDLRSIFGLYLVESDVLLATKCYMKRSIPVPGRLYVTIRGLLFRGKPIDKRVFIPTLHLGNVTLITRWHARGICVTTREQAHFEFMQLGEIELRIIVSFCQQNSIGILNA